MENLPFVIWLLSYNLVWSIINYIDYKSTWNKPSQSSPWVTLINLIIYICIAYLLYR